MKKKGRVYSSADMRVFFDGIEIPRFSAIIMRETSDAVTAHSTQDKDQEMKA